MGFKGILNFRFSEFFSGFPFRISDLKCLIKLCPSALMISGCAYVSPYIQEFNIVSVPQEIELGRQMEQQIAREMEIMNDPALNRKIQGLGRELVMALPRRDFDYRFYVVKDPAPNAFTIPGGKIYVHSGLFGLAESPAEVAGVLAHEIGHAYERHPAKALSRAYGVEALSRLLFKENQGALQQLAMQMAQGGFLTKYGRDDEREADEIAYFLLRRAGFPADGLLTFLKKLAQLDRGASLPFLSSHPPTPERIARLEALIRGESAGALAARGPYQTGFSGR